MKLDDKAMADATQAVYEQYEAAGGGDSEDFARAAVYAYLHAAPVFSRDEILEALSLRPCHVTGMHTPEHHLDYTCEIQKGKAFDRALVILGATFDDVPRHLHDDCYWCHGESPSTEREGPSRTLGSPWQEKYREQARRTFKWAGVPVPKWLKKKGTPN